MCLPASHKINTLIFIYISRYIDIITVMNKKTEELEALEDFLRTTGALYDETRVKLLKFIDKHGALCICDLQNSFDMLQSRLSRHIKILKESGFLTVKKEGRWAYYSIRTPIDRFRLQAIEEIRTLPIELPELKRISGSCEIE